MEKFVMKKVMLVIAVFVLVSVSVVEGGRVLKEEDKVVEPETFPGADGFGTFPGGGTGLGGFGGFPGAGGFGTSFPGGGPAGGFGFTTPSGSGGCAWPAVGCFRIPNLFRGPSVPIVPGETPTTASP